MIFFVPIHFNQKVIITCLHLTQTVEVEECLDEGLILSLLSQGSLIDSYHLLYHLITPYRVKTMLLANG